MAADQSFTLQLEKHILNNGRLTIPSEFVRKHNIARHSECLFKFGHFEYHMDLHVHGDSRRQQQMVGDHVTVSGSFKDIADEQNLRRNCWLIFTIGQPVRDLGYPASGYDLVFNVAELVTL